MKKITLLATIAAAFVSQPLFGDHQLVFTEYSSSSLTVTYDGSMLAVSPNGPDAWIFTPPSSMSLTNPALTFSWMEPENSTLTNSFFAITGVVSDQFSPFGGGQPNGFTYVNIGTDTSDNVPIDATFLDLGDTPAVPDMGTTFSVFGLSLTGLAFLRRKLC